MVKSRPNFLFITVDQMRYPRVNYETGGMLDPIKEILSFGDISQGNDYTQYFPGFLKLRDHSVVLRNHHIATSACVPSRAVIYTGQYGTRTNVVETDSLFKFGSDPNFPWLHPRGIPTIGDWFRAGGYSTHYFGKWDLSYVDFDGPGRGDLNPWGFDNWQLSMPDAQGGSLNELGVYRDPGYADLVATFLRRKGMNFVDTPDRGSPFFCVASFVNPHDIASAYPISWWMPQSLEDKGQWGVQTESDDISPHSPRPIPGHHEFSNKLPGGTMRVPLNPRGFPQDTFSNPPNLHEALKTKPDCQFDYSYKMGLALKARRPPSQRPYQTLPFQTQPNPDQWFEAYGQFYAYCHTLVDLQIERVLKALDESGLREDTVVVFLSDHGDYGGAHGGMVEKWHTAYEEILHVPMLVSHPSLNDSKTTPKYIDTLTSHIDVVPTLMGLAGFDSERVNAIGKGMDDHTYIPLPGADLTPIITGKADEVTSCNGEPRRSVLFMTDDTITDHLREEPPTTAYKIFEQEVEQQIEAGVDLKPGSVCQPNHIRCLVSDDWKLARYFDPNGEYSDQWELYYRTEDANELHNLVSWDAEGNPVAEPQRIPNGWGLSAEKLEATLPTLQKELERLEEVYLTPVAPEERRFTLEQVIKKRHNSDSV